MDNDSYLLVRGEKGSNLPLLGLDEVAGRQQSHLRCLQVLQRPRNHVELVVKIPVVHGTHPITKVRISSTTIVCLLPWQIDNNNQKLFRIADPGIWVASGFGVDKARIWCSSYDPKYV